jgi:hypothetical protein
MYSFKTYDAERRSRILALKTSKKPFGEKKERKENCSISILEELRMLNLNETTKGFELYKKQLYLWKYLHVFTTSTSTRMGRISGAVCEQMCIVGEKKLKLHTFPLLILTPSEFMLKLLAYDPITSHSNSSCFSANSKLPISISGVYPGKFKRIKFSFKTRRGKKKPLYVLLFTGINNHIRISV